MIIRFIDTSSAMIEAFKFELNGFEDEVDGLKFEFIKDSIFNHPSDALVSPANSFGFMDGGLDYYISEFIGNDLQEKVQDSIKKNFNGELLVGQSLVVETGNELFPYLISAPTMRVPMKLSKIDMENGQGFVTRVSANVYLAAKSIFVALKNNPHIKSIAIPGLGTGVGGVSPESCAFLMRKAFVDFYIGLNVYPESLASACNKHAQETILK